MKYQLKDLMTPTEYSFRSAAWKRLEATIARLRTTPDDTEAVLGAHVEAINSIRQELADDRRARAFTEAVAK